MSDRTDFSDELLNALVDGQLAPEDAERIYAQMQQNPELTRRVCELRTVREMVRIAYSQPPMAGNRRQVESGVVRSHWPRVGAMMVSRSRVAALAALPLVLGVVIGWFLHGTSGLPQRSIARLEAGGIHAQGTEGRGTRVLFHVSSADTTRIKATLDEVENVLNLYRQRGLEVRVEVLSNGPGLGLLRVGTSPYPERIVGMMRAYKNLTFVACQNTIDRLRRENGIKARLLPGTTVTESGVVEILLRQQQGWSYIQI